jgi:iron-sulfur cluster repair protein YtfE (RIC family)
MGTSCGCGCGHRDETRVAERYTAATPVGEAAREAVGRAVLEAFGLNHCCGAHLTLREGAAAAGVAVDDVLAALNAPAAVTP